MSHWVVQVLRGGSVCVVSDPPGDSGPQKVQHYLDVISYKIKAILVTRIVVSTNSADLERAPGARSIGEEFAETTILVTKL